MKELKKIASKLKREVKFQKRIVVRIQEKTDMKRQAFFGPCWPDVAC